MHVVLFADEFCTTKRDVMRQNFQFSVLSFHIYMQSIIICKSHWLFLSIVNIPQRYYPECWQHCGAPVWQTLCKQIWMQSLDWSAHSHWLKYTWPWCTKHRFSKGIVLHKLKCYHHLLNLKPFQTRMKF